ncbi:UPF0481 protein At3g47200-like [Arachis ipaensis]|uniref:Uncharacterized protein n=1 Tax=Arachis hypogaea TaxID=3818 RepID=A0A444YEZ0_ARAHY|nr:UPF0481 protein At3g47200-like [Arachis ipaensis]QHN91034.1 UPF0481 protein [Arachis hypogaea]RYR00486.1 hypothetical protein Ahy_B07g088608 [Arachis hypogaea]
MEDHESHNPNDVAMEINEMLEKAQPLFRDECCIYRVPHEIRGSNPDAYTPRAVSIGPFHHGDQKLLKMEDQKRIYCRQFIERSGTKSLESFVSCVQELEPQVRACYSDDIKLSKEEHVMVILVDCCFILELLLRFFSEESKEDDSISLFPWLDEYLRWDLLLLENQIPFFVFNNLYDLAFATLNGGTGHPSLLKLILGYFFGPYDDTDWDSGSIEHFTDLLRTFHLKQSISPLSRKKETLPFLKSAIQLHEAGVKFKVINKRSLCLLDLKFSGHTLEIPQIELEDKTEIWLRNMVALEQCYYPDESYITDYTAVLDYLINTEKDVDFLVNKGIIINWLGDSKAVAKLFNGLGKNIIHETFNAEYLRICKDLNDFCEHPCHRKVATLRRDYCNTPWKTVASVAGIALLILTVIQTVCSIIQVVQGSSK